MSVYSGELYDPPRAGLPMLAVLFKRGQAVACFPVTSRRQGEEFIARAIELLPLSEEEGAEADALGVTSLFMVGGRA
jgi:hypothetical protein